jgi:hypothetical protein
MIYFHSKLRYGVCNPIKLNYIINKKFRQKVKMHEEQRFVSLNSFMPLCFVIITLHQVFGWTLLCNAKLETMRNEKTPG